MRPMEKILEEIIMMTQEELFDYIYKKCNPTEKVNGQFIYIKGDIPILLTAHLDIVHANPPRELNKKGNIWSSPTGIGGDDRCGVAIILSLLEDGYKPNVLFLCDEESGCLGAQAFCKTDLAQSMEQPKFIVELDRRGENEVVFYDCLNETFKEYITGFDLKLNIGSYSDITFFAPVLDAASCNISVGYFSEHTTSEYINTEYLENAKNTVEDMIADIKRVPYFKGCYRELLI